MKVVAAPDKFRGTTSAREAAEAMATAATEVGWSAMQLPLADGGEGTLDALGGPNRWTTVSGPLGDPVRAGWRLDGDTAVVEMAQASGLDLAGGATGNDALSASTYGTGELIAAAVEAGAREVIVTVGGSATTDGGLGALRALHPFHRLRGVRLVVATDVRCPFVQAATEFGPQKGATAAQVRLLSRRLEQLRSHYLSTYGRDVGALDRAGAAGGLAGGLAALGAELTSGFDLVADHLGFVEALHDADLVVTGEGHFDHASLEGKVVGQVIALAHEAAVPVLVIAGGCESDLCEDLVPQQVACVSLVERFGEEAAVHHTTDCIRRALCEWMGASFGHALPGQTAPAGGSPGDPAAR